MRRASAISTVFSKNLVITTSHKVADELGNVADDRQT
jgi:hypothetical protein